MKVAIKYLKEKEFSEEINSALQSSCTSKERFSVLSYWKLILCHYKKGWKFSCVQREKIEPMGLRMRFTPSL